MGNFTEQTLLTDIEEKWGKYGAHADLCRWMIREVEQLRAAGDALHALIDGNIEWDTSEEASQADSALARWEEVRRG